MSNLYVPVKFRRMNKKKEDTISILKEIKKYLKKHPKKVQALVKWYVETKSARPLLIKMIDGLPRQQVDTTVRNTTVNVDIDTAQKYGLVEKNETPSNTKNSN